MPSFVRRHPVITTLVAATLAASTFAFFFRRRLMRIGGTVLSEAQRIAFKAISPCGRHADAVLQVAAEKDVSPFLITAIIMRESACGVALRSGTGDFAPRSPSAVPAGVPTKPAGGGKVLPADGLGWGRGLMQVDYGWHYDWISRNDWRDPVTNIRKGVDIFRQKLRFFKRSATASGDPRPLTGIALLRAAVAAYNTGEGNVLRSLKAGRSVDRTTAHGNYSTSVIAAADNLLTRFRNRLI